MSRLAAASSASSPTHRVARPTASKTGWTAALASAVPGRQHEELSLLGGLPGAEHGSVDEQQPVPMRQLDERALLDADRGHLRPHLPGAQTVLGLLQHVAHVVAVAEHRDDHIGTADGVGRIGGEHGSGLGQRPRLLGGAVPDPEREPGGEDVVSHSGTHDARTEECDGGLISHASRLGAGATDRRCSDRAPRSRSYDAVRALVAQGIEHRFPKPCVAGSNPAGGTVRDLLHSEAPS